MFEDDETTTISSTGMMTPTEFQDPTITILVYVRNSMGHHRQNVQVKMRQSMLFGELVASLRARFDQSEGFGLQRDLPSGDAMVRPECALIFDSDTPASLELTDRAKLTFQKPEFVEAMDVSMM
ncbi:hypothetical protein KCU71_g10550, partial [Aureobasidium melanogenum]